MPQTDITNRVVGSLLSLEFMGACILVAVAWGSMGARLEAVAQEQSRQEQQQTQRLLRMENVVKERGEKLNHLERDMAVVKNDVGHTKEAVVRTEERVKRTEQRVEEILELLREQQ